MTDRRTYSAHRLRRRVLVWSVVLAVVYLGCVEAYRAHLRWLASRPVVIRYKPASELAKIAPSKDDYPCLAVEDGPDKGLRGEIRQCLVGLHTAANIEQYEVDLRTGRFIIRKTDLFLNDDMPLALTREYGQWDSTPRAFGLGSNHDYDIFVQGTRFPYVWKNVILADGNYVHYERISEGTSYVDDVTQHIGTPSTIFDRSRIAWNEDHWDYTFADGRMYQLPDAYRAKRGAEGALVAMRDAAGNEIKLQRDAARNLVSLTSPHGRWIHLTYDASNRIAVAEDDAGESRKYAYDPAGRLVEVRDGIGDLLWRYDYELIDMTRVERSGKVIVFNQYKGRRMERLEIGPDQVYRFDYLYNRKGDVVETTVTDPQGKVSTFNF